MQVLLYALKSSWWKFANMLPLRDVCLTNRLQRRFASILKYVRGGGSIWIRQRAQEGRGSEHGQGERGQGGVTHGERKQHSACHKHSPYEYHRNSNTLLLYFNKETGRCLAPLEVGTSKQHSTPHPPPRTYWQVRMLDGNKRKWVSVSPGPELAKTLSCDNALDWACFSNVPTQTLMEGTHGTAAITGPRPEDAHLHTSATSAL